MRKIKQISYFGFADAAQNDPLYKEAYEVSKYLTGKGYVCINGGGPGTMRAVSEGAKAAGGYAIGEGRDPGNPLDEEIRTKNYLERTLKLLELGDAYVIFRGGTGTISEFGMAWGLARLYFGHHKPLILYGEFWNEIIREFERNMRIRPEDLKVYKVANSPDEAFKALQVFEGALAAQDNVHQEEKAFQL